MRDLPSSSGPVQVIAWIAEKDPVAREVVLRDPSGYARVRVAGDQGIFELPLETLAWIDGYARGGELEVRRLAPITRPIEERRVDYLDPPATLEEYLANYAWYARGPRAMRAARAVHEIQQAVRGSLVRRGFIELPPLITQPASDPGLRGARKVRAILYGFEVELASSMIMYKQLMASIHEKIFYMARNIREEPLSNASTGRHLYEFTQVDVEWGLSDAETVMRLAEEVLSETARALLERVELGDASRRNLEALAKGGPYARLTYDEALEFLKKRGFEVKWGEELPQHAEAELSRAFDGPLWLVGFPAESRGFYYYPRDDDPRYNVDFNLLLPGGYGEVVDGGCREYRYERIVERLRRHGEPLEKYSWFLEAARAGGIAPSCGWGLGLERLARYALAEEHVAYATPHPRVPGVLSP
ncbi:MAG: asparagine synthetase A [Desulfurococcaceae archaeon]